MVVVVVMSGEIGVVMSGEIVMMSGEKAFEPAMKIVC